MSTLPQGRFAHALARWAAQYDLDIPKMTVDSPSESELYGVHGEELSGIAMTSALAARYRHAHATQAGEHEAIGSLPALILTGTRASTRMQLAVLELHQKILHPSR